MDNLTEKRRAVLRRFVAEKGGHAAVVARFRLSPSHASYLSQLVARDSVASFGETSARNWEQRLRMKGNPLLFPQVDADEKISEGLAEAEKANQLVETLENLADILRDVPIAERETIAAVLAGLARTPEVPTLTAALITLLEKNTTDELLSKSKSTAATVK